MSVLVPSDPGQGPLCGNALWAALAALRYSLEEVKQILFLEPALLPQASLGCDNQLSLPALPQRKSTMNTSCKETSLIAANACFIANAYGPKSHTHKRRSCQNQGCFYKQTSRLKKGLSQETCLVGFSV